SQRRPIALAGHELRARAGGASHLSAFSFFQLDVVNHGAERDSDQGKRVADENVGLRAGRHRGADLQAIGREDVSLLAIAIVKQSDARAAIRVVLDRRNRRRNVAFVATKIDLTIALLMTAADEARSHTPDVSPPSRLRLALGQRLLGP